MPQQRMPADDFGADLAAVRAAAEGQPEGDDFAADLAAVRGAQPPDRRSTFARVVDTVFSPIPAVQSWIEARANTLDTPALNDDIPVPAIPGGPLVPKGLLKGFLAGSLTGAGQLLTPGDALLTIAGLRGVKDAGRAISATARGLEALGSGALVARGAERVIDADSPAEIAAGVAQSAFGALGVHGARQRPAVAPPPAPIIRGRLRAAPITVTPEGGAVLPGRDIPMQETAAGTFAPEVPSVQRAPIVGFDAQGGPIYGGEASAASVTRPVRALLPERAEAANELIPVPGGKLARRGDVRPGQSLVDEAGALADDFAADLAAVRGEVTPTQGNGRPPREVSTRPAAILDREWDGAEETRRIFSSDPNAIDAPKLQASADEAHELRRMLAEMESIEYTPRSRVEIEVGRGGASEWVAGGAGARVYDDVTRGYASGKPTRADVTQGIQDALEGKHSALGQRALAVARGRRGGDPMLSRPQLSDDAGDLPQTGQQTDEDFSEFDRFVSRLSAEGTADLGGLGETGSVNPLLAARLGGATAGAFGGAATADEDDSTARTVLRSVVGGVLGAAAPSLARPGSGGRRLTGRLFARSPTGQPGIPDGILGTIRARPLTGDFPTTGRPAAQPGQPRRDPLEGTEVFVSKFAPELQTGIRAVLEKNHGFDAQRRGVVSAEDTARLAESLAVDASRRLKPGTTLNASGVRAFADGIATAQAKVQDLAGRVTRGQSTDADMVALEQARAEVATLTAGLMGARSEAGRALAEFNVLARVLESGNPNIIREAANGLRGDAAEFAAEFAQLPDDPLQRYRWLQSKRQPTGRERVRAYFYSNILSGIRTHARNTVGNAAQLVANLATHPFAVGADAIRSAATGQARTIRFSELPSQAAGAVVGIQRGFDNALFALRHGVNRQALTGALSAAESGKFDLPRIEFSGGGANPFNWPGRALDAEDQFFRTIAKEMELAGGAHAQARSEGLTGQALERRMAAIMSGTDDASRAIQDRADAFARRAVFQEPGGRFVQSIQGALRAVPELSFVLPFVRTPGNIIRQGLEASPAGFVMSAARQGGREGAQAQGRAAAGSVALGALAYLVASGKVTGAAPSDPAERAQFYESGKQPNAIQIGDKWISYSLFQPLSVPLAVMANGFQAWKAEGAKPEAADDVAERALSAIVRTGGASAESLLDQSFLSGIADLFELVQNPDKPGALRFAGRFAHSMTPLAGAQRTVKDALDPMIRDPRGIQEQVRSMTPGLSTSVPARLDRFGNEIQREGGAVRRAVDPFNVSRVNPDPVLAELGRLNVRMGMPGGTVTGAELSREQSRTLQQLKGSSTYAVLSRVIAMPAYQQLTEAQQAAVLDKVIDQSRGQIQDGARKMLRGTIIRQGGR
jgi:hypothetical protein